MKQIIIVSRIHLYQKDEEFTKYATDNTPEFIAQNTEGYKLLIVNGSKLRGLNENNKIVEKILSIAIEQGFGNVHGTGLAYHFKNNLNNAVVDTFSNNEWKDINVKKYSSADPTDKPFYDILNPLGKAIQENKPIDTFLDEIWLFFSKDALLNAKLDFLHDIHDGKIVADIPKVLQREEVITVFELLKDKKYDNNDPKMRENLKNLRDAVLKIR